MSLGDEYNLTTIIAPEKSTKFGLLIFSELLVNFIVSPFEMVQLETKTKTCGRESWRHISSMVRATPQAMKIQFIFNEKNSWSYKCFFISKFDLEEVCSFNLK